MKLLLFSLLAIVPMTHGSAVYEARVRHIEDQNYAKEIELLENTKTADAYNFLGEIYYFGWGVKVDVSKAKQNFEKASNLGHAAASNHLGRMYVNGEGVKSDLDQAIKYFTLAESRGFPGATENKAAWEWRKNLMAKGIDKAVIAKLAENTDAQSLSFLGETYHFGYGVPVDYQRARQYYEKALALKSADAANHLARLYLNGEGVTKDSQKAQMYYEMERKLRVN